MSPLSWPVVLGTLAVGSPALHAALASGTLSPDVALVRVLLCAAGVWAVFSLVSSLATKAVATNTLDGPPAELVGEGSPPQSQSGAA